MITCNDIYESKKNPLVLFEYPQSTERRFLFTPRWKSHKEPILNCGAMAFFNTSTNAIISLDNAISSFRMD
ncbi:MAG TPA: hypothetical protein VJH65_02730 [Candidatus Nanoarchaeia archaeon]|nr:hypothetical protein [Candidatus Nanoarchaeia archaeon]